MQLGILTLTEFITSSTHHIPWVSVPGMTSFTCMYSWLNLRRLWISRVDRFHTWRAHLLSRSIGHLYKINLLFEPAFTYTFTMVQPLLLSSKTFKLKVKIKMKIVDVCLTYSDSLIINNPISTFQISSMNTQKEGNSDDLKSILSAYRFLKKKTLECAIKGIESFRKSKSGEDNFLVSRNTNWIINIRRTVCRIYEYWNPQGAFWLCYWLSSVSRLNIFAFTKIATRLSSYYGL